MAWLDSIAQAIQQSSGISPMVQAKLFWTILIIALSPPVYRLIFLLIRRASKDHTSVYRKMIFVRYAIGIVVPIIMAFIWFSWVKNLATYMSIIGAGLVIALQDTVSNLAGFVFIIWRKPFTLGDRIEIDGIIGDVVDVRVFQFTLVEVGHWVDADQSTGRIVHIPNSKVLKDAVANYTTGFEYIWHEIPVLVTFESNWRKAKQEMMKITDEHCRKFSPQAEKQFRETAHRYLIISGKLTPIVYTRVEDCGVLLTLRYLTHARERRGTEQQIWEAILDAFAQHDDIDFAYPTTRYYDNHREGKGAGGRHQA